MTETSPEYKEIEETVKNKGLLNILVVALLYLWSLFFISVGFIMLYDRLFHIDFNSPSYVAIVAAIFILVTSIDLALLNKKKLTPTILIGAIVLSPFLILYKLFKDADLFSLNKKSTPANIKKYIFPWQVA
ncbi:MAG TPA: hypothetical protein ACFYEK_17775 [Candidatus Wunengus sp. YC60]|uniref:hypothetical protein n=1 Tax=Candidatus Wunengus sp. YC60 TaxID=3367697 RepID=UPI004029F15D